MGGAGLEPATSSV